VEVKGIRCVAVWTDRMSEMRAFATDVLGLRVGGEHRSDFVELVLAERERQCLI
jgi:catechol 2,3-dioxygenase-like lactoylglutathione lyase family enzyme